MSYATSPEIAKLPVVELRSDIEWTPHADTGRWVAKDPLTARFYYFSEVERTAATLLNGKRAFIQVVHQLTEAFPHMRLSVDWLMQFVARLNAAHLLLPSSSDVVLRLLRTNRRASRRTLLQILASPLSIRIPLFNPQPWLEALRPLALLLFNPVTAVIVVAVGLVANVSVLGQLLTAPFSLNLDLASIQGDRWLLLLLCYAAVKSLHELGHGLACVRWRTQCNEMGLLILFFTPCLYCDTTDAWKLSSRWQRAAIGAAGMYVELILASIAAVVWLLSQDGIVHGIAANVMLICSVGTLLINGNPFLKYDGYYIVSDLWKVPNLSDQSREALMLLFVGLMTGRTPNARHLDRNIWALAAFAIVSMVYRAFILVMILWLAWNMLVPLGLGFLTMMVFAGTALGLALSTVRMAKSIHRNVLVHEAFRWPRLIVVLVFLLLMLALFAQVPFPVYVRARGVTDFGDKVPLFAHDTVFLKRAAAVGKTLEPGDPLLTFDNPEKKYELQTVQGEIAMLEKKIEYLSQLSTFDTSASFELPTNQKLLSDRKTKASLLESELSLLNRPAPYRGQLLPASLKLDRTLTAPAGIQWSEGPLDASNQGCLLERGTLLGWFSALERPEVIAIVSEQDIKRLRLKLSASCQWDSHVSSVVTGKVTRISPDPIKEIPEELVGDPSLLSQRDISGKFQPLERHYAVTIAIEPGSPQHLKGELVTVQIQVASQPLLKTLIHAVRLSLRPL